MSLWQRQNNEPELVTALYEFTRGASYLQEEMYGEMKVKRDEWTG